MKILLISADPDFPGDLQDMLHTGSGQEVVRASDALDAWRLLDCGAAARIDLCVLDERLPKAEATEFLLRLRADQRLKSLKVIFCATQPRGLAA